MQKVYIFFTKVGRVPGEEASTAPCPLHGEMLHLQMADARDITEPLTCQDFHAIVDLT